MRNIRNFVIVFAIYFCLAGISHARAVDSLFTVRDCTDPTKPCATTGDGVNTVIPLQQEIADVANTIDALLNRSYTLNWLGILQPHNETYYNGNPKLDSFANQIQSASDFELNPAQLQENEQHDESSKSASMTSRICVLDPKTGQYRDAVSETTIVTADQPWLRAQGEGSRRLSSFTTGYVQESQDYTLPPITIKQDAALPCDSIPTGESKPLETKPSQFNNSYGSSASTAFAGLVYKFTAAMIKLLTGSGGTSSASGTLTATAQIVGTAQNPFAGHADALTAGCATSSDLASLSYASDEQKQKLCAAGGFVNSMYRQDEIDPTYKSALNANGDQQQWDQTITKTTIQASNANAFAARVEAAGDYTNCTLMPADYQTIAGMSDTCNKNWVGSTTTGGWNCDTSVSEQTVKGLNPDGGQSYADRVYGGCAAGTDNAWKMCKNDVIARAVKACVDPLFALAIWLHESGASNYTCGRQLTGRTIQDFGVNIQSIAGNFSEQLDRFLKLPASYAATCPGKTLRDFVAMYWIGNGCYNTLSSANKAKIDGYIQELQLIYSTMAPGVSLPTWPAGC